MTYTTSIGRTCRAATGLALLLALCVLQPLRAQGPETKARFIQGHWESLRVDLLQAWQGADGAGRSALAAALTADDKSLPIQRLARALALADGGDADAALEIRGAIYGLALPEVVDPEGALEPALAANLTLHLAEPLPVPENSAYEVHLLDAAGTLVRSEILQRDGGGEKLRSYSLATTVAGEELADGVYTWRVLAHLAGQPPRATDPRPEYRVAVRRGFLAQAQQVVVWADALPADPEVRPWVQGQVEPLRRAMLGLPQVAGGDPVAALRRAAAWRDLPEGELASALQAWRRSGSGWHFLKLPGRDDGSLLQRPFALVRLPFTGGRPLVVAQPGAPTWDTRGDRPIAPRAPDLRWIGRGLDAVLGAERAADLILLPGAADLPGGHRRQETALQWCAERAGVPLSQVVLVAERDAAVMYSLGRIAAANQQRDPTENAEIGPTAPDPHPGGLVLVNGGGMHKAALEGLPEAPMLLVASPGTPGGQALQRTWDLAQGRYGDVACPADLRLRAGEWPWQVAFHLAVPAALEIAAGLQR